MPIEDIEIKAPEILTQEMGESVFNEMFDQKQPGVKNQDADLGVSESLNQVEDDIPNASIRLEKMKKQRDDATQEMQALKEQFAELKGQISAFKDLNNNNGDIDTEVDPTEYMDDVQKLNYTETQNLKEQVKQLTDVIQGIQTDKTKDKIQKQEDNFFDSKPELKAKKDEVVGELLDYLKDKPSIKAMIKEGSVTLNEVYGMYSASKPQSTKTSQVSNPDKFFSGHSEPVQSNRDQVSENDVNRKKALRILRNKESMNKSDAVNYLKDTITSDLISQLDF